MKNDTNNNSKDKRTVIYSRTATYGPDGDANLDRQVNLCRNAAVQRGNGNADIIRDIASYDGRQALLQAAQEGSIGRVYVARRDRISRDPQECEEVLRTLRDCDVEVVIVAERGLAEEQRSMADMVCTGACTFVHAHVDVHA